MRLLFVVPFALLGSCAAALAQAPSPANYSLEVSPAEADQIGAALAERPFKDVAQLMGKLQGQVQSQQAAARKAAEPKPVEPPKPADPPPSPPAK